MRTLIFCLILIHVSIGISAEDAKTKKQREAEARAKAAATRKPTAKKELDTQTGKALVNLAAECEKATTKLSGRLNVGSSCTEKIKTESAHDGLDPETRQLLSTFEFKDAVAKPYQQAKGIPQAEIKEPTEEVTDASGKKIRVSVLTPEQATALHKNLFANRYHELRLNIVSSGCVARAHALAVDLENQGIAVGKLWSYAGPLAAFGVGKLNPILPGSPERSGVEWAFHVAPFVLVKKDKDSPAEKWIIDPALNRERPISIDDYKNQLMTHPNLTWSPVVSSRFTYTKNQVYSGLTEHKPSDYQRYRADLQTTASDVFNGTRGGQRIDFDPDNPTRKPSR